MLSCLPCSGMLDENTFSLPNLTVIFCLDPWKEDIFQLDATICTMTSRSQFGKHALASPAQGVPLSQRCSADARFELTCLERRHLSVQHEEHPEKTDFGNDSRTCNVGFGW